MAGKSTVRAREARSSGQVELVGDGEEDGAAVADLDGLGAAAAELFVEGGAEAGAEAAEGVGDVGGEARRCDRGRGPSGGGRVRRPRGRRWGWRRGGGGGIDEGAEDAGGEGFAGAGRALEDEDGMGSVGAEGGEEPGEAAEPVGVGGEVEAGAEGLEGGERVAGGRRDGDGEAAAEGSKGTCRRGARRSSRRG